MPVFEALDDRTSRKEEQRFEEGMRHQVKDAGDKSAHPNRRHHEAQLADGRISQHLLDIELTHRNCRGKQGRTAPTIATRFCALGTKV